MHCRQKLTFIILLLIGSMGAFGLWPGRAQALDSNSLTDNVSRDVQRPWKGDLGRMMKRRIIRVLVTYNKTNYFFDGARKRGVTVELFEKYASEINKRYKKGHLKAHILYVPVARDKLIPYLIQGKGDIAAANLTITPSRAKKVDFTNSLSSEVKELVVTSPHGPKLRRLEDLSGKKVLVRKSSSYYQSLVKLNAKFKKKGLAKIKIAPASEDLETEDILELINSGMFNITIADDYLANFWVQIFKGIKVHHNLSVRKGGSIAWAVRKNNPELKASLNRFIKRHRKGTLFGNVLIKRYYQDTKFVRDAFTPEHMKRFQATINFFKKIRWHI